MPERLSSVARVARDPFAIPFALIAALLAATIVFAVTHPAVPYHRPIPFEVTPLGDDVPRLAPVRVGFPSAPEQRDPAQLVRLEPKVEGEYLWLNERTLLFQAAYPGYERGREYTVRVTAAPEAGLAEDYAHQFTATGLLKVVQVTPAEGEEEVSANAPILVQFSRGVAPLTLLEEMARTTPVLVFDPPLPGKGEWVNTALYRFTPTSLPPNREISVRLAPRLSSAVDGQLAEGKAWSFKTWGPAVDKMIPEPWASFYVPTQPFTAQFNLPMDRVSVQRGFTLRQREGGAYVSGTFTWSDDDRKVVFQPTAPLAPATYYDAEVAAGVADRTGARMVRAVNSSFQTLGPVKVLATDPSDGGTSYSYSSSWSVRFNNPIDPTSFEGRISISSVDPANIRISPYGGSENEGRLYVYASGGLKASTKYTASVAAGAKDKFGQPVPPFEATFTTGGRDPAVDLATPGGLGVYSSAEDPQLYFHAVNTTAVTFTLYRIPEDDVRSVLARGYPCYSLNTSDSYCSSLHPMNTMRVWTEQVRPAKDQVLTTATSLGDGKPLPKGHYYVRASGEAVSSRYNAQFLFSVVDTAVVTKQSQDELLVWVLDLATGEPVNNLAVTAVGGRVLGSATRRSDASGIAKFPLSRLVGIAPSSDTPYVFVNDAGRLGLSSGTYEMRTYTGQPQEYSNRTYVAHLYTDRVIYRPGETVEVKGVIRVDQDAAYAVPPKGASFVLSMTSLRYTTIFSESVTLNEFGSFALRIPLPAAGPVGDYTITIGDPDSVSRYPVPLATADLAVVEFRKPEYEVALNAPTVIVSGDPLGANVQASFLFGGGVANAAVRWDVISESGSFSAPTAYAAYRFGDPDPEQSSTVATGALATGTGVTDAQGKFKIDAPTSLPPGQNMRSFRVLTTVSDQSAQGIPGSARVLVLPGAVVPGVQASYVAEVGKSSRVGIVTLAPDATPLANRDVTLRVYERSWVTSKEPGRDGGLYYRSVPLDRLIETLPARTDDRGRAEVEVTAKNSGSLRLVAEALDDRGRGTRAGVTVYAYGGGRFNGWRYSNDETFSLVADKDGYVVGESAEVIVAAPFPGAIGLVTIERGRNIWHEVRRFDSPSEVLSIPIEESSVPNIFVSVVLYRAGSNTDPVPRYNVGTVKLPVSTAPRQLGVSIQADRDRAAPRDRVSYTLRVTDSAGNGVPAEVSVSVVDKAVLLLAEEKGPNGLRAFWFERALGVTTSSSLKALMARINDTVRGLVPLGGGKGGDGLPGDDTRKDFKNTAYWSAQLRTNNRGEASVEVPLPDNVTTWRMQVRAITPDARVGESVHELLTTTSLIARPALPRFVRVGDTVMLRMVVRNGTLTPSDVTVSVDGTGFQFANRDAKSIRVPAEGSIAVDWPATVLAGKDATVRFTATGSDGLRDAVETTFPIRQAYTPEAVATGGSISGEAMPEAVYLPPTAVLDGGDLKLTLQHSVAANLGEEIDRFRGVLNPSTDFLSGQLSSLLGLGRATGSPSRISIGAMISELISRSRGSGGLADCASCSETDAQTTAYALIALGDAKKDGFTYDTKVVEAGQFFLRRLEIDPAPTVEKPFDPNRRALMLYALAHTGAGRQMSGPIRSLFQEHRSELRTSGRAYLLMAMSDAGITDSSMTSLRSDLIGSASQTANGAHWEDNRSGQLSDDPVLATSLAIEALTGTKNAEFTLRAASLWLLRARLYRSYEPSWTTGRYTHAIGTFVAKSGNIPRPPSGYSVTLNGNPLISGIMDSGGSVRVEKVLPLTSLKVGAVNAIVFAQGNNAGQTLYTMLLRYQTSARDAEAVNRGFAVAREITTVTDPGTRIHQARLGETVRVKVTVMVKDAKYGATVIDSLPAGLEPVDPRLRTTDPQLAKQLDTERKALNQAGAKANGYVAPWMRWYYSPWSGSQIRDDRLEVTTRFMPVGIHEFVYFARATTPGTFLAPPTLAMEGGSPDVFGRGDSELFTVTP